MATSGEGSENRRAGSEPIDDDPSVADLMRNLQLTEEEGAVLEFSDDEEEGEASTDCALVGKVLSPASIHVNTVSSTMKHAWGNPVGLKFREIGTKGENMFLVEFGSKIDLDRVLGKSPWMVGRYAILLQRYDPRLRASDIKFDSLEIWARVLDLPLGWMNKRKGTGVMNMLGKLKQLDVDADGKASGAFLRARIVMDQKGSASTGEQG